MSRSDDVAKATLLLFWLVNFDAPHRYSGLCLTDR